MAERNARGGSVRPRWNTWSWDTPPPDIGQKGRGGIGLRVTGTDHHRTPPLVYSLARAEAPPKTARADSVYRHCKIMRADLSKGTCEEAEATGSVTESAAKTSPL